MNKDSHLIFEALHKHWKLTSMDPQEAAMKFGKENVRVTSKGLRNGQDMVEVNVPHEEDAEQRRLDPSCWSGYHKDGTKMKGDTRVNNCVKNEQEEDKDEEGDLMMHMKQKGMIGKKSDTTTGKYGRHREEEESDAHAVQDIVANLLDISHKMWRDLDADSFYSAKHLELIKSHAESILRRVRDVAEDKSKVTSVSHDGYRRVLKSFK
jgi:hypothetical protein